MTDKTNIKIINSFYSDTERGSKYQKMFKQMFLGKRKVYFNFFAGLFSFIWLFSRGMLFEGLITWFLAGLVLKLTYPFFGIYFVLLLLFMIFSFYGEYFFFKSFIRKCENLRNKGKNDSEIVEYLNQIYPKAVHRF